MGDDDGGPWVTVPERLDRPLRLGPFPSAREAVKFVGAVATGAVVCLAVAPWAGLPIVVLGAAVVLWRPEGEPLDARAAAALRWAWRRQAGGSPVTDPNVPAPVAPSGTLQLPDGREAVVLQTAGVPLAFLPPPELAHQFERYRELLRSVGSGLIVAATAVPIHAGSLLPPAPEGPRPDRAALDGYRDLVTLLARRRSVRRVLLALPQELPGPEGRRRLEGAAELLAGRLADLGLRPERLRHRALTEAARRLGWSGRGGGTT